MKVKYGRTEHEFDQEMIVRRVLEKLGIVPEGVVVAVNGELVTADTMVRVGDEVDIIRAVSGGSVADRLGATPEIPQITGGAERGAARRARR